MMNLTKKQVCLNNKAFAYYSGCGGVEIHHIEYGIDDHIYCVSNAWHGKKRYHKLKVYHDNDDSYIKLRGYKIPLNECIRI
mgnify:CR=1 FL=1